MWVAVWSWLQAEWNAMLRGGGLSRYALDLSDQKVALVERTAGGLKLRDAASHRADDFELQVERILKRVAGRGGGEAAVDLLLPRELTLARVETFPAEARRNLRDETWWRLESITPYRPEELCYDVSLLGVEPKTGFLEVSVAVAPRDIVEEAIDYARRWGFSPQKVTASAEIPGFAGGPLFHQAADLQGETRSLRRGAAALAAAALLLAAVGVSRGVAARDAQLQHVQATASAAKAELEEAESVRAAALALADRAMLPSQRRRARSFAVDWMETLAGALPPETVVDRLTVSDGRLRVEGAAANAEAALAAVNLADAFKDARLAEGPVRIQAGPRRQRFVIEATLARVLTPEALEQASASALAVAAADGADSAAGERP